MTKRNGIGSHTRPSAGASDDWLTPPEIVRALGPFDLDPCAMEAQPWPTAARHYTWRDGGLTQPWAGRVWCNPPYGPNTAKWLAKLARHGDGIALVFARTETRWFFEHVWEFADGILFVKGRLTFYRSDGTPSKAGHNSGGPSVLIAYGGGNVDRLAESGIGGALVRRPWSKLACNARAQVLAGVNGDGKRLLFG